MEICSIKANFCKTRPRLPSENEQKMFILAIFCTKSPKQVYLRRQKERGFMHKTWRLKDEDTISFQMFIILLSFIKFCIRKPDFCVQTMSEQYLDACCCFSVRGEHEKPKFGDCEKNTS